MHHWDLTRHTANSMDINGISWGYFFSGCSRAATTNTFAGENQYEGIWIGYESAHGGILPPHVLVGGFNPSEKYESQLGWLLPEYGNIKNVPNHKADMFEKTRHIWKLPIASRSTSTHPSEPGIASWLPGRWVISVLYPSSRWFHHVYIYIYTCMYIYI